MGDGGFHDNALGMATTAELCQSCVITDPSGPDNPIVYVTPEFELQTGYSAEEALGRNCRFLQGPGTDPRVVEQVRAALAGHRQVRVTLLNYRKDGSPFMNRLSIRPVFGSTGALQSFVGVQRVLSVEPRGIVSRYSTRMPAGEAASGRRSGGLERRMR